MLIDYKKISYMIKKNYTIEKLYKMQKNVF